MPYSVQLLKIYIHPRSKKRLSQKKATLYNRRAKKPIKPYLYLQVKHTLGNLKGLTSEQKERRKRDAGKIVYTSKLTTIETILPLKGFHDRHLRQSLGRHGVFKKLFDDFHKKGTLQRRGSIRITIGGMVEGKRLKQVTHLAFSRKHWLEGFGSEERAYEEFKDWMIGSILANLRRRDLRLSNPKESLGRVKALTKKRADELHRLDFEDNAQDRAGLEQQIKWDTAAIRKQKKSKQLTRAFIKIEKLV